MSVLVTGRACGSWQIRGEQLGRAIGATVVPMALDVAGFETAVLVKRAPALLPRLQAAGARLVWDIVDSWQQPEGNGWDRRHAMAWLADRLRLTRPAAVVAATEAMAEDVRSLTDVPVKCIRHHGRPGLRRTQIRPMGVVGYEGGVPHLGAWAEVLEKECARRGWRFVLNPASINELDVVVALRERDGYAPMHWKSNVKLANAQASGTPIICAREKGYVETDGGGIEWLDGPEGLAEAFDRLEPVKERRRRAKLLAAAAIPLSEVAAEYRGWLESLCASKC